jgi:hypothetical protein
MGSILLVAEIQNGAIREAMVNLVLGQRNADTAALRRYMVDEGFLDREGGMYWRSGGSVSTPEG